MVGRQIRCDTNRIHKKHVQEMYQTAVVLNGHAWETFSYIRDDRRTPG
jgi:hypothetical protein